MGNKKFIFISLLILAIGFAAVSTTLYITGNIAYQTKKSNFDVYFSGAELDEFDVSNEVIKDKKHIEYTSNELKKIDDISVLKYEVTNDSTEYDATVTISCTPMKTDYMELTLTPVTFDIDAGEIKTGEIEAKLIKVSETEQNINIDCELSVLAKERTSIETILEKNDSYKISGVLTNSSNDSLNYSKLLIKSERQIVKTDLHGYFYVENLERGRHHIYYKEDGDYDISDEELEDYLIAEVSTNGHLKMLNKNYKINNLQYSTDLVDEGIYCAYEQGNTWDYDYDATELNGQKFEVAEGCQGTYKIELWGAGASSNTYGAYTAGQIKLKDADKLYVYVGQRTQNCSPYTLCTGNAYNGGGAGGYFTSSTHPARYPGGGGATDVRYFEDDEITSSDLIWNSYKGLNSRIMVAGGAGSTVKGNTSAGGLTGYTGSDYTNAGGGTQISGGAASGTVATAGGFGYGGNGYTSDPENPCGNVGFAGGGGYYGGGGGRGGAFESGCPARSGSGGGGSSFISGFKGCVAINGKTDRNPKNGCTATSAQDDIECSKHYSGLFFENTVMIDGKGCLWNNKQATTQCNGMPNPIENNTITGNGGDGHARITLISLD